jgi:hypothetical protein
MSEISNEFFKQFSPEAAPPGKPAHDVEELDAKKLLTPPESLSSTTDTQTTKEVVASLLEGAPHSQQALECVAQVMQTTFN